MVLRYCNHGVWNSKSSVCVCDPSATLQPSGLCDCASDEHWEDKCVKNSVCSRGTWNPQANACECARNAIKDWLGHCKCKVGTYWSEAKQECWPNNTSEDNELMSPEFKQNIGIAVGSIVAAGLLALGIHMAWKRYRRQRIVRPA